MSSINYDLVLRMLVAHFLSDFIFQPTDWARQKDEKGIKSLYFWLHGVLTLITLYVFIWNIQLWPLAISITVIHIIIDSIKSRILKPGIWVFFIDQSLHIATIIMGWLIYTKQFNIFYQTIAQQFVIQKYWLLVFAYILLSIPSSVLIKRMTEKWSKDIVTQDESNDGLENAGKWIGILERFLIFTFIILNEIEAIGFLLAAKSVFRFGDLKVKGEQKKTEYIIIGTFTSFTISIAIGLIYRMLKETL